jgi:hypothetical protein
MNRRSGLGLSVLRTSLWTGQTVFGESGLALLLVMTVGLSVHRASAVAYSRVFAPDAIPEEQMCPLMSFAPVTMFVIAVIALLPQTLSRLSSCRFE